MLRRKAITRKSSSTLRPVLALVYSFPLVSFMPVSLPIRHEAKKPQTGKCFKCGCKGHNASQCPSRQVNTTLHGNDTSNEEPIDEKIEIEAKDAKA